MLAMNLFSHSKLSFSALALLPLHFGVYGSTNTTTITTATLTYQNTGRVHGWVHQPNSRGTIDIIWTSIFTTFIATYVMLCLNVPATKDRLWHIVGRRLFWMGIAIFGPEFVLTAASGQWGTAKESVKLFHDSGFKEWTLRHGFFADMGGFHLVCPDRQESFPINAKHLHWLVTHKHLPMPGVSDREVDDKSKQDTVGKVVTCMQVGYLVLQCLGRAFQHLAITTLELTALAIVVCSTLTSICWLRKPLDVRTPIRLELEMPLRAVLEAAGEDPDGWKQTPLDFIDDLRPSWNLNVQSFMKMRVGPKERPMPRIGNERFPNLDGRQETYLCVATLAYAAIHLAGWNFAFPTRLELILWRASSMFLFGTTAVFWIFETAAAWWRKGRLQRLLFGTVDHSLPTAAPERTRPPKQLPLPWEFWSILPLAILYGVARLYIIIEAFIGLRDLDRTAYMAVQWTAFIPHIG